MPFRSLNPVTITCEWCGVTKELKIARPERKHGNFCSRNCSGAWHRDQDAQATWRLMELTRQLWESRPQEFKFAPAEFPGIRQFRVELNATGKWLREISNATVGGCAAGDA